MILGAAPTERQLADPSQRIHKVLNTARVLYGLIHARYILTAQVRAHAAAAAAPRGGGAAPAARRAGRSLSTALCAPRLAPPGPRRACRT